MTDLGRYGGVNTEDLTIYLSAHNWLLADERAAWSRAVQIWTTPDGKDEVVVPLRRSYRDYGELVFQALTGIGVIEGRSPDTVLGDVAAVGFDVLRFRNADVGSDDSIPLDRGIELIANARACLVAAACSTVRPSRSYGRHFLLADEYMKRVQMGQTERGSFVVAVRSPLAEIRRPDDIEESQERKPQREVEAPVEGDDMLLVNEPVATTTSSLTPSVRLLARDVVGTFIGAVRSAEEAATEFIATEDMSAFDRRVDLGVSANLCKALASIKGTASTSIEVSVVWASRQQPQESYAALPVTQRVSSETRYVFERAADYLRQPGPEHEVEISGLVVELRRHEANQPGRVKVRTSLDGKSMRNVVVSLGVVDYLKAVQAHRQGRRLICKGIIEPAGRRMWKMAAPTQVDVEA